jgi:hypothetical protein
LILALSRTILSRNLLLRDKPFRSGMLLCYSFKRSTYKYHTWTYYPGQVRSVAYRNVPFIYEQSRILPFRNVTCGNVTFQDVSFRYTLYRDKHI